MPSLRDPKLKLRRAKEHLDALNVEIGLLKKSKAKIISTEDDFEHQWYVVKINFPISPHQSTASLIAGDFVSCLRSALDHLTWQLALLTTDSPSRDICFPICEKNSLDTQLKIVKSTFGIPDAAVSLMKSLQPYNSGDAYKSTHLWRLNRLWNIDKHREVTPHNVITDWIFTFESDAEVITESFGDTGIMKLPLALKDEVELNPDAISTEIVFGERKDGIRIKLGDFVEMYEFVANSVLPAFAGFFSE